MNTDFSCTRKISAWQLIFMLFLSRMFNFLTFTPTFNSRDVGTSMLFGNIISVIIQLIILLPIFYFWKKNPNISVLEMAFKKNKIFGFIIIMSFFLVLLIVNIASVFQFEFFMTNTVFSSSSGLIIMVIMVICGACAAIMGLEGLSRASIIFFAIFIFGTALIFFTSLKSFNILNIKPIVLNPTNSIGVAILRNFSKCTEFYLLLIFAPNVKQKMQKTAVTYLLLVGVFFELFTFLMHGVLGEYLSRKMYPFYALATVAEADVLGRLDSVHMVLWILTSFVRVSVFLIASYHCLQIIFPKVKKFSKITLFSTGTIICISAYFLSVRAKEIQAFPVAIWTSCAIIILCGIFPLIMNFTRKKEIDKS